MLSSVRSGTDYGFEVCRITSGDHIEIRQVTVKTLRVFVYAVQISLLCTANFFGIDF
jgi:hypothetical protein